MLLITDYIEPAELTGFVRADLEQFFLNEDRNFLLRWFPNEYIDDVEYDFATGGDLETNVVGYRAYGAESQLGSRPGFGSSKGAIPPLSEKTPLTEYENLRRRNSPDQAIRNVAERDARRSGRGIARRMELARGQILREAQVTIVENKLVTEIVFDRDVLHTTTAGVPWGTSATADPVADLLLLKQRLAAKGFLLGAILLEEPALRAALRTKKVIDAVKGAAVAVSRVSKADFDELLQDEGLPATEVVAANVAGQSTIGDKNVIGLPSEPVGLTIWGTPAEALEDAYDLDLDNDEGPGVVSGQYKQAEPLTLWTKTGAIAVPALGDPNATICMQVLA